MAHQLTIWPERVFRDKWSSPTGFAQKAIWKLSDDDACSISFVGWLLWLFTNLYFHPIVTVIVEGNWAAICMFRPADNCVCQHKRAVTQLQLVTRRARRRTITDFQRIVLLWAHCAIQHRHGISHRAPRQLLSHLRCQHHPTRPLLITRRWVEL